MVVDLIERERVDRLFHALADGTRRDIVTVVLREEQSVSALASRYPMSFAAVQKHVAVLEQAGLVTKRKKGREQLVAGDIASVRYVEHLLQQLETVWRTRLDRFEQILNEQTETNQGEHA